MLISMTDSGGGVDFDGRWWWWRWAMLGSNSQLGMLVNDESQSREKEEKGKKYIF